MIVTRMNKQNDEKKEKGAAQINIPSNLIFAGMKNDPKLRKTTIILKLLHLK